MNHPLLQVMIRYISQTPFEIPPQNNVPEHEFQLWALRQE